MKGEFLYANGITIGVARRIYDYAFGDFFLYAEKNDEHLRFDIYVKDKILDENNKIIFLKDAIDLDYFSTFWNKEKSFHNPPWKIFVVDVKIEK